MPLASSCTRACVPVNMQRRIIYCFSGTKTEDLLRFLHPVIDCHSSFYIVIIHVGVNDTELRSSTRMQEHFESLSITAENLGKICVPSGPVPNMKKRHLDETLMCCHWLQLYYWRSDLLKRENLHPHRTFNFNWTITRQTFNIPITINYRSHNLPPLRSVNHGVLTHICCQSNIPPLHSPSSINFSVLNVRLLGSKTFICNGFLTTNNIDFFLVTESWLLIDDTVQLEETSPLGYFEQALRIGRQGWWSDCVLQKLI